MSVKYSYVTVAEKRAPTDESVRLLREMEQKAEESVVARLVLNGDNFFDVTVLVRQDFLSPVWRAEVYYELNGKRHMVSVDFEYGTVIVDNPNAEWLRAVNDAVAKDVAKHITLRLVSQQRNGGVL